MLKIIRDDNMELDDLKRSWTALDKQLQTENIVNEKQVAELIAQYQSGAMKGINRITSWQRLSVVVGIIVAIMLIVALFVIPLVFTDPKLTAKSIVMVAFLGITLIFGLWWDLKTYRWSRNTKVDEMPVVTVMSRINTFQRWIKYEVIAISIWSVMFVSLYYWIAEYYNFPALIQVVLVGMFTISIGVIIYFLYKKMIYNNLDKVKKNLNDLNEIETNI